VPGLPFVYSDGGRKAAGFKGYTGDCSTRAIAIATERPYVEVYDALTALGKLCRHRKGKECRARTGVCKKVLHRYMAMEGWTWTPTMSIGSGTRVHMAPGELPTEDRHLIVALSRHLVAVIDGVVHDHSDVSRDGTRAVYGYWHHDPATSLTHVPNRQRIC
jgi:hypothetical protein